ncbi:MAG: hypothetical protein FJ316_04925 [SAR202 cluster bacterium]|nr:hypothetical protein [SAR202 cluster bacterium]
MTQDSASVGTGAYSAAKRRRFSAVLMLAGGIGLAVVAAGIFVWANGYVSACRSAAGQAVQLSSQGLRGACASMNLVWYGALLGLAASAVVVLAGLLAWRRGRQQLVHRHS